MIRPTARSTNKMIVGMVPSGRPDAGRRHRASRGAGTQRC
jgi:hypothetical protein